MKSKHTELLSDLTRLLKKYKARDWEPLIRLFSAKPSVLLDAGALAATEERAKKKKSGRSHAGKKRPTSLEAKRKPQKRPSTVKRLKQKALRGSAHPTYRSALAKVPLNALQTLYVQSYNDKRIPKGRREIMAALDVYMQKLSEPERSRFLLSLPNGSAEFHGDFSALVRNHLEANAREQIGLRDSISAKPLSRKVGMIRIHRQCRYIQRRKVRPGRYRLTIGSPVRIAMMRHLLRFNRTCKSGNLRSSINLVRNDRAVQKVLSVSFAYSGENLVHPASSEISEHNLAREQLDRHCNDG